LDSLLITEEGFGSLQFKTQGFIKPGGKVYGNYFLNHYSGGQVGVKGFWEGILQERKTTEKKGGKEHQKKGIFTFIHRGQTQGNLCYTRNVGQVGVGIKRKGRAI